MKKLYLFGTLLVVALLVTGCGSKNEVVCTQSVSGVKVDMIMNFKDDKIDTMGVKYSMDLSNYSDDQVKQIESQNLCSSVQTAMGTYGTAFTNCKQKVENKNLLVTADFDIQKLPGAINGQGDTKEQAIKGLESQGYKCTK